MKPVGRRTLLQSGLLIGAVAAGACGREDTPSNEGSPSNEDTPRDVHIPPDGEVDLLIVGAGIAGLAAAGYAAGQGLRCVVLEARDRVGGRIWTSTEWPEVPVDLGASWIHGTDGNPVYDEITRLGIETAEFDVGSYDGAGSLITLSPNGTRLDTDAADDQLAAALQRLERRAASSGSMQAAMDRLPAHLRGPAVLAGLTEAAGDYGATPQQLALAALDEEDGYPGAQRVLPGGYAQLTGRLAEGLDVRTGVVVTEVSLPDPCRVEVRAGDRRWTAGAAIVTVPLGVLKAGAIRFDPPLPERHRRAVDALGFGRFEKLVLRFTEPFWDDVDQIQVGGAPGAPFAGWYNLHRVTGEPVLMALNGGAAAAALDGLPPRRIAELGARVLAEIYPGRFREPVGAQSTDWWDDEFSRGSYSFTAVGSGVADRAALAEPIAGRLWLAGEAVEAELHSTVHGAWISGRAAARAACR